MASLLPEFISCGTSTGDYPSREGGAPGESATQQDAQWESATGGELRAVLIGVNDITRSHF